MRNRREERGANISRREGTFSSLLRGLTATVAALGILGSAACVWGQPAPRKPPVAPTNGKPARAHVLPKTTAKTLAYRLKRDRRIDSSGIHVTAAAHRVALNGTIPSYYQRRVALQIAQSLVGVTYVVDRLRVLSQPPPAAVLTAQIHKEFQKYPLVASQQIQVRANRDVVTLTGTTSTLLVKQKAIRIANRTPYVSLVQDHLTVKPGSTDETLISAVMAALARQPKLAHCHFTVLAKGSYIYLRGTVYSKAEKQSAADVAAQVPGVTGMTNSLTILPARLKKYAREPSG